MSVKNTNDPSCDVDAETLYGATLPDETSLANLARSLAALLAAKFDATKPPFKTSSKQSGLD
jgi:hypothetical protein